MQPEKIPVLLPFLVLIDPNGVLVLKLTPFLLKFIREDFPILNLLRGIISSISIYKL